MAPKFAITFVFWVGLIAWSGQRPVPPNSTDNALAIIEGNIIDAADGNPIQSAVVKARGPQSASATTDALGHYRIEKLSAGTYYIFPVKEGYGRLLSSNARKLRVASAMRLSHIDFQLRRESIISGRVLDVRKNPIPGARVTAWFRGYRDGRPFFFVQGFGKADDRGEYKISGLKARSYYVGMLPSNLEFRKRRYQPRPGPDPQWMNGPVFYPNATSLQSASPIRLRDSEVLDGIDLISEPLRTFCVYISVEAARQPPGTFVGIFETAPGWYRSLAQHSFDTADQLELCGVPPGTYKLLAASEGDRNCSTREFIVEKENLDLGPIALENASTLTGEIELAEKDSKTPIPANIHVTLEPEDRPELENEISDAEIAPSGGFAFPNVCAGKYWMRILGLPPGYYVKETSESGVDARTNPIKAPGNVRVTLATDGPLLAGEAINREGKPVPDTTVILHPVDFSERISRSGILAQQTDQDGRFQFRSAIPPGNYELLALSTYLSADLNHLDAIRPCLSRATKLTLGSKEQKATTITVAECETNF
jgi:protocatechuate 3,4-dioxygenase beta subunit